VVTDAVAVRFQLVPEVIDLSYVLAFSGFFALLATLIAAALRFEPDRLARLVVFGNLVGAVIGTVILLLAALDVL
jgi:hypothetical protein